MKISGVEIGSENFCVIAGPCTIESYEQLSKIAGTVVSAGASFLRGGAFKARTSPRSFQGLHEAGLVILSAVRREYKIPTVCEITDISHIGLYGDVDIIQVGARNMQNFELLFELGKTHKPILLKRGFGNTTDELLHSAEYIQSGGGDKIILCERGIRTFEKTSRATLDIAAIPYLRKTTGFPVISDPSHAGGDSFLVPYLALASVAAEADGVMVEVHNDPKAALCDGGQALRPDEFLSLCGKMKKVREALK